MEQSNVLNKLAMKVIAKLLPFANKQINFLLVN